MWSDRFLRMDEVLRELTSQKKASKGKKDGHHK